MKRELLFAALLALPLAAPAAMTEADIAESKREAGGEFRRQRATASVDLNQLRMAVDESQALLDGLARESLGLDKAAHDELIQSLRKEYHLDSYAGKARKALDQGEVVLQIQSAIKAQQQRLKGLGVAEAQPEEAKLLGMQSDLIGAVDALRDTLRSVRRNASEDEVRDLHNWMMVSEGLLRGRREDREAAAGAGALTATAQAQGDAALSAEGLSPTADAEAAAAPLSPPAAALSKPLVKPQP